MRAFTAAAQPKKLCQFLEDKEPTQAQDVLSNNAYKSLNRNEEDNQGGLFCWSLRRSDAKGGRKLVKTFIKLKNCARWANGERNNHYRIQNPGKEVHFRNQQRLHSVAETEVIGNHWGQTFPTVRAKDYGLKSSEIVP